MEFLKKYDDRVLYLVAGVVIGSLFSLYLGRFLTLLILAPIFLISLIFIVLIGIKFIFSSDVQLENTTTQNPSTQMPSSEV